MAFDLETPVRENEAPTLDSRFADRLEEALRVADRERRRHIWIRRARVVLPLCLLIGPIVGWRLMLVSPGEHVYVDTLSWVAFLLDVGVHVNTAVLSYLGLQALPAIAGAVLFVVLTITLLKTGGEQ